MNTIEGFYWHDRIAMSADPRAELRKFHDALLAEVDREAAVACNREVTYVDCRTGEVR